MDEAKDILEGSQLERHHLETLSDMDGRLSEYARRLLERIDSDE